MALHGCLPDAERQARFHGREQFLFEGTAGAGIADDADFVSGGHLRVGEIAHVAEDAADRRSEAMDDAQGAPHGRAAFSVGRGSGSENAFAHIDRVARQQRIGGKDPSGHHLAVDVASDVDIGLVGARG